jgi:hypothetical protein
MAERDPKAQVASDEDRRAFLKAAGRFAVVTPPAVTMLLSTSLTSSAIAASGAGSARPPGGGPKKPPGARGGLVSYENGFIIRRGN